MRGQVATTSVAAVSNRKTTLAGQVRIRKDKLGAVSGSTKAKHQGR